MHNSLQHHCTKIQWYSIRDWILLVCFSWRYEATEGPRVNFVMREVRFEIYTWILCRFIPPWETNKYNSILIFILYQNCTVFMVLPTKYPFFNTKHPFIILRASLFVVTPSHVASLKIECQFFLMFIVGPDCKAKSNTEMQRLTKCGRQMDRQTDVIKPQARTAVQSGQ